jgi:hypothetical protein
MIFEVNLSFFICFQCFRLFLTHPIEYKKSGGLLEDGFIVIHDKKARWGLAWSVLCIFYLFYGLFALDCCRYPLE